MIELKQYEEAVKGPGALEGEEPATAYFYEAVMNGEGTNIEFPDGSITTYFSLSGEEHNAFEISTSKEYYAIYQNSMGFIYGEELSIEDIEKMKAQAKEEWACAEEEDESQD
jgi:hypothetical protein